MSYEISKLQNQLRSLITDAERIVSKSYQAPGDSERLKEINTEVGELKARIEARQNVQWARGSAGMLNLSSQASVTGMVKSGMTYLEQTTGGLGAYSEGEGVATDPQMRAIREPAYHRSFMQYLRTGERGLKGDALKVLQEGLDPSGGYLVSDDILNRLIGKQPTPTRVNSRVTRITTKTDRMVVPKNIYTTDDTYTTPMRVSWVGELPAGATSHRVTEPTFGLASIPIWTCMLSIPVSNNLIDDANYDLVGWLSSKFEETANLLFDSMILSGTGAGQPEGILESSSVTTVNSGSATTLTADGLIDLAYDLEEQYDDGAVFVMNKTNTGKVVRKLKDGDGRYLWGEGLQDSGLAAPGVRGSLLGYPVMYSGFAPNVSAGNKPIVFGDLSGFFLVTRMNLSIVVARELYVESNQTLLQGKLRFGGLLVEDWKVRTHTISA